jgi:hypothetical protein
VGADRPSGGGYRFVPVDIVDRDTRAELDGAAVLNRFLLPEAGPPLRRRDEALLDAAEPLVVPSEG